MIGPRSARSRGATFLAAVVLALCSSRAPLAAAGSAGADQDPSRAQFSPKLFGPGEEVHALLLLPGIEAASGFVLKAGSGLPASEDPELRELALTKTQRGWELVIRFVPWSPGPGRIPSISAHGVLFPSIPYSTGSRLESEAREIASPRPQREPPGTAFYLYGLAGAALFIALACVASIAYLLPAARALLARWRAAQAFKMLCRSLDYLEAGTAVSEPAAFYAALSRALRLYLAERIDARAPALTASEFAALPASTFPASGLRDLAASLFAEAEQARYAGEMPGGVAMKDAAKRVRNLAEAAEEALDARL